RKDKKCCKGWQEYRKKFIAEWESEIISIASVEERAERRFLENKQKGYTVDIDILKKEIKERDEKDMNRKTSPLVQAEDAHVVDTTSLTIDEVVTKILSYVNKQ